MVRAKKAAPVEGEHPIAMVTLTSATGYEGEVRAGRHRFVTDEGPELGGDDQGPSPYQLLAGRRSSSARPPPSGCTPTGRVGSSAR